MRENFIFTRGAVWGFLVGVFVSFGLLIAVLIWLLDFNKRITPLSTSQRSAVAQEEDHDQNGETTHADSQTSNPDEWPEDLKAFLTRGMKPDPTQDHKVSPITGALKPTTEPSLNPSANAQQEKEAVYMSPTLDVEWVNLLVSRFFVMLRESDVYKLKTATKMSSKMNAKLKNSSLIQALQIVDIDLGDCAPKVMGIRLVKGLTSDLAVTCEIDLVYGGGASIAIEAQVSGIKLPARIYLNALAGKIRVRWPSVQWSDMLGVTFMQDPGVTFTIDAPLSSKTSETIRGMVNRFLESLARKVFLEMWVFPAWRTFYMPMVNPTFEEQLQRQLSKPTAPVVPSLRSTLATKAATLWETRGPLLKFRSLKNMDPFNDDSSLFPINLTAETLELSDIQSMDSSLTNLFVSLVDGINTSENTEKSNSGPSVFQDWKLVKKKPGISYYRQSLNQEDNATFISKTILDIECDAARVFSVLSNTEHFRHLTNAYTESSIINQYDKEKCIKQISFQLPRSGPRKVTVLEIKKDYSEKSYLVLYRSLLWKSEEENDEDNSQESPGYESDQLAESSRVLTKKNSKENMRTVHLRSGFRSTNDDDESVSSSRTQSPERGSKSRSSSIPRLATSPAGTSKKANSELASVYIYGYLIEPYEGANGEKTKVTLISSCDLHLSKILGNFAFAQKIKGFIEELVTLTATLSVPEMNEAMIFRGKNESGGKVDKLKSYLGATTGYLMREYSRLRAGNNLQKEVQDSENDEEEVIEDESVIPTKGAAVEAEEILSPFNGQQYIERDIGIRQVQKIPILFDKEATDKTHSFRELIWEFSSKTELPIFFGIEYSPNDPTLFKHHGSFFEKLNDTTWALFPLCSVSAFSKPAFGKFLISEFPSGQFTFIFDNQKTPRKSALSLMTRAWIETSDMDMPFEEVPNQPEMLSHPLAECHSEVLIPRKSFLRFSLLVDERCMNLMGASGSLKLNWSLSPGEYETGFVLFYEDDMEYSMKKERLRTLSATSLNTVESTDSQKSFSMTQEISLQPQVDVDKDVGEKSQGNETLLVETPTSIREADKELLDEPQLNLGASPPKKNEKLPVNNGDPQIKPSLPTTGSNIIAKGQSTNASTSSNKISFILGKAKDVYRDVRQNPSSTVKAAIGSRLQSVVSKSDQVAKRLKGVIDSKTGSPRSMTGTRSSFVESSNVASSSATSPAPVPLDIDPGSKFLSENPRTMVIIPYTKLTPDLAKSDPHLFQGTMDISKKVGVYTWILDNTSSLVLGRMVNFSILVTCEKPIDKTDH